LAVTVADLRWKEDSLQRIRLTHYGVEGIRRSGGEAALLGSHFWYWSRERHSICFASGNGEIKNCGEPSVNKQNFIKSTLRRFVFLLKFTQMDINLNF
jgi:hypothetical protein